MHELMTESLLIHPNIEEHGVTFLEELMGIQWWRGSHKRLPE
jgi:hypothetical protein